MGIGVGGDLAVPITNPHHPLLGTLIPACFGLFRLPFFWVLWLWFQILPSMAYQTVLPCLQQSTGPTSSMCHRPVLLFPYLLTPQSVTTEVLVFPGSIDPSRKGVLWGTGRTWGSQACLSFEFSLLTLNLSFSFFLPEKTASHLGVRKITSGWVLLLSVLGLDRGFWNSKPEPTFCPSVLLYPINWFYCSPSYFHQLIFKTNKKKVCSLTSPYQNIKVYEDRDYFQHWGQGLAYRQCSIKIYWTK